MSYDFRSRLHPFKEKNCGYDIHDLRPLLAGDIVLLKHRFRQRDRSDNRPGSWQGYSILEHCPEFLNDHLEQSVDTEQPFILAVLFYNISHPNSILCRNGRKKFGLIDPDSGIIVPYSSIDRVLAHLEQPALTH